MNDLEKMKAYLGLSQQLYTQHHNRRSLEWQIHLAVWTLLVAAGYAVISHDRHWGAFSLMLFLVVPFHTIWCVKIHRGLIREQDLSIKYRNRVENILENQELSAFSSPALAINPEEERSAMPVWLQQTFESYWWWLGAEFGTTCLIACVVVRLAW